MSWAWIELCTHLLPNNGQEILDGGTVFLLDPHHVLELRDNRLF